MRPTERTQFSQPVLTALAKAVIQPTVGKNTASCAGKYRMALAKMMGMTPAVLTLMGRYVA